MSDFTKQIFSIFEKGESFSDYPESAKKNAQKVLDWKEKYGDDVRGMTKVGWTRANQIANGENLSYDTVKRIYRFKRHKKNAEIAQKHKDEPWKDAGHVAWLGWGGDSMINWAESVVKQQEKNNKREKAINTSNNTPFDVERFVYEDYLDKSLGRKRESMPQIDEDILDNYIIHFSGNSKGAKVKKVVKKVSKLKPTQNEFDKEKIRSRVNDNDQSWKTRRFIISKDNYLVDGHHDWAIALQDNEDNEISCYRINLTIKELLRRSNLLKFTRKREIGKAYHDDEAIILLYSLLEEIEENQKEKYVVAIIQDKNHNILFLKRHPNLEYYGDYWCLPAGKVESEEDVYEAMQRELAEELSLYVSVQDLFLMEVFDYVDHKDCVFFIAGQYEEIDLILDQENTNYSFSNFLDFTYRDYYKFIPNVIDQLHYIFLPPEIKVEKFEDVRHFDKDTYVKKGVSSSNIYTLEKEYELIKSAHLNTLLFNSSEQEDALMQMQKVKVLVQDDDGFFL